MTLHKLRKALMQGRFFYVGRLSHFALWRINGSAPRHIVYSHSMVEGGFDVTSYTMRFTPFTSFTIRREI